MCSINIVTEKKKKKIYDNLQIAGTTKSEKKNTLKFVAYQT